MTQNRYALDLTDIPVLEARSVLEELLSDERFHITERGKAILRYIAEHHFSGKPEAIKGYSIAIDVLGRPTSFDPSTDPIVRIELSRLRSALVQYYQAFGREKRIEIGLPKGHYILTFNRCRNRAVTRSGGDNGFYPDETESGYSAHKKWFIFIVSIIIPLVSIFSISLFSHGGIDTEKPVVVIDFKNDDSVSNHESETVRDTIVNAVNNFNTLILKINNGVAHNPNESIPAFLIRMKYRTEGDTHYLSWRIKDSSKNEIIGSGVEQVSAADLTHNQIEQYLASELSYKIAASNGIINTRLVNENNLAVFGNSCVVKAEINLANGLPLSEDEHCLERTLKIRPTDSDAMAALARVLISNTGDVPDIEKSERSLRLAHKAAILAPASDRVLFSLMQTHLSAGHIDLALRKGERGIALNPNNRELKSAVALAYFTNGNWGQAHQLLVDDERRFKTLPVTGQLVLLLDALRRGNRQEAKLRADGLPVHANRIVGFHLATLTRTMPPSAKTELQKQVRVTPEVFETMAANLAQQKCPC